MCTKERRMKPTYCYFTILIMCFLQYGGIASNYAPASTTILAGTLVSGTFANLAGNDGSYYVVSSGSRTIDWYGSVTIAGSPASVARLTVAYAGMYSGNSTTQTLHLYNWTSSAWTQIDSRAVGTTQILVTSIQTSPGSYISSTGEIRVRVVGTWTGSPNRTCSADFLQFTTETVGTPNTSSKASVKVLLEGPYNSATTFMNTTLGASGILAQHFGAIGIPSNAVDSINIELRNSASASAATTRKFRPAWLMNDGTIRDFVDTAATCVTFDTVAGNYYLVVRHRNHLGVITATGQTLTDSPPVPYDFTISQSQALGDMPMKQVAPGKFALFAGDADQSDIVSRVDVNLIFGQLNAIGYSNNDINLSGIVTAADANVVFGNLNSSSGVPTSPSDSSER